MNGGDGERTDDDVRDHHCTILQRHAPLLRITRDDTRVEQDLCWLAWAIGACGESMKFSLDVDTMAQDPFDSEFRLGIYGNTTRSISPRASVSREGRGLTCTLRVRISCTLSRFDSERRRMRIGHLPSSGSGDGRWARDGQLRRVP